MRLGDVHDIPSTFAFAGGVVVTQCHRVSLSYPQGAEPKQTLGTRTPLKCSFFYHVLLWMASQSCALMLTSRCCNRVLVLGLVKFATKRAGMGLMQRHQHHTAASSFMSLLGVLGVFVSCYLAAWESTLYQGRTE
jgi:hypothetical protein